MLSFHIRHIILKITKIHWLLNNISYDFSGQFFKGNGSFPNIEYITDLGIVKYCTVGLYICHY